MARPLIISYGNSLRGDDGVSFAVLDRVEERCIVPFDALREPQLDFEFSDEISNSSLVIFVDASVDGDPGSVDMQWLTPVENEVVRSHECSPGALLAYTAAVHGRVPRASLVTVVGSDFCFTESLSAEAASGVPLAADMITALLETDTPESAA